MGSQVFGHGLPMSFPCALLIGVAHHDHELCSRASSLLCLASLCVALRCFALLRDALLCLALLCNAQLCFSLLCFVLLACFALPCLALLCFRRSVRSTYRRGRMLTPAHPQVGPLSPAGISWELPVHGHHQQRLKMVTNHRKQKTICV